jgi:ribosome recycling factor
VIAEVLQEAGDRMAKAVEVSKDDFNTVRTGRANPALFQRIPVDYYGTPTPLGQLASIQAPEARMLVITPYDKSALKEMEKAIATAPNLGGSPSNDGSIIRVVIPELTQDRRKEFVKLARSKGEDAKVSIRSIRRHAKDALDRLAKDGEAGEDDVHRAEGELEKLTHKYTDQVDEHVKAKEAELLEI